MQEAIVRFKQYLEYRYPSRETPKHYLSDLKIFKHFVGERRPREITGKDITAFVQAQSQQQLQPATINRRLATLASFFEFLISEAEDDGWHNPVRWKQHSIRTGQHLPRDMSDETANAVLAVIDDLRDRAIFSLMLKAGLRVGEVVVLNGVDLESPSPDGLARLRVRGKGDKERTVWLTAEAWGQVQRWLAVRPETDDEALFLNQHGRRMSVAGVQYRLKQYCDQAGVQVSCHQFRHTFARRLAEQQMPLDSLAKLMGHHDLQTTQRYIDGADPTVRADFLTCLAGLETELAVELTVPSNWPVLPAPAAEDRPAPSAVMAALVDVGTDLPTWLREAIYQHTLRRVAGWTPHQASKQARYHFGGLCRLGRWLVQHRQWSSLADLRRVDLVAYVASRQAAGLKSGTINTELTLFRTFWRDLLDQEVVRNGAILQVKGPEPGDPLPRYLPEAQFRQLEQVVKTETSQNRPRDMFNRAWFYLLAHGGLRISEALNLRLSDCDFNHQWLCIRSGKGNRDRVIPLSPTLARVLQDYLTVRETGRTDHLLLFQGRAVEAKVVRRRLHKFGQQAGLEDLCPHRLRHTLATRLINQGMPITSLKKLLGHQGLNQTLLYARVYDETVRQQFVAAMARIEGVVVRDWPISTSGPAETAPISIPEICDSV